MTNAIDNFKKYEGRINTEVYLDDFLRTLVSFGIRQVGSNQFIKKVEDFLEPNVQFLGPKMCENLLFFLSRLNSKNIDLLSKVIRHIEQNKFIESGAMKDHVMLMNVINQNKISVVELWD